MKPLNIIKMTIISSLVFIFTASAYAEISVTSVKGTAAFREGRSWLPLKIGQKLSEGVKISTGANSFVELNLNSIRHSVKIKPLTVIQVFSKETENTDTHIGLKRGRITAKVPRDAKVKTIFKVSTPIATSSVRGTEEDISYGPDKGMIVEVISGIIEGKNRLGKGNLISGRQKFIQRFAQSQAFNILSDVRNQSVIRVYGNGLTSDEIASMIYFGDEMTGSSDDDASNLVEGIALKTRVSLNIEWPQ
jgi:hypothetical protein